MVVVVGVVAVAGAVAVPVAVAVAVAVAVKATVAVKLGWRGMAGGMEVVMGGTSNQVQPPAQHSLRPACQMADPREQRQQRTDDLIRVRRAPRVKPKAHCPTLTPASLQQWETPGSKGNSEQST